MVEIKLDYEIKFHENLYLSIECNQGESVSEYGDLYYFANDIHFIGKSNSYEKAVLSFISMLGCWIEKLKKTTYNVFLPFDFSDEYIGGLFITNSNDNYIVRYGVSREFTGSAYAPFKCELITPQKGELVFIGGSLHFESLKEVISNIERIIIYLTMDLTHLGT